MNAVPGNSPLVTLFNRGLLGTMMTVAREEGPGALWKGIEPGGVMVADFCLHADHEIVSTA